MDMIIYEAQKEDLKKKRNRNILNILNLNSRVNFKKLGHLFEN